MTRKPDSPAGRQLEIFLGSACAFIPSSTYDGTDGFGGTSSAAPHVAGAAALVLSRYPALSVAELQELLEKNAVSLYGYTAKDNQYGSGKLNLDHFASCAQKVAATESSQLSLLLRDAARPDRN